jgi:DNA polymerase-3 subunit delta'
MLEPGDNASIRIEAVRDVIDRAAYRPFEGKRRVVIVDEADALVPQAQNALLKTLEEPPSASVFLLVSSLPDSLLPTVRSRCPRLRFSGLSPAEVASVLMADHGVSEEEAHALAVDADGSIGQALEAKSVDLTEARATAAQLIEQVARGSDPAGRVAAAGRLMAGKDQPPIERARLASCLRAMASLLRDLGIVTMQADRRSLANTDLTASLERLSPAFDAERCAQAYAAVDRALAALDRNASPKVVADWLLLQL